MLTNYERRVLGEIELELRRRRSRTVALARAMRLPAALLILAAIVAASATARIPAIITSLSAALVGIVVGWLLVSAVRRCILGPRVRRQLRKARRHRNATQP